MDFRCASYDGSSTVSAKLDITYEYTPVSTPTPEPTNQESSFQPNIVVIQTDDMRADLLDYMPIVKSRIVDQGIIFNNAFATTSICCPSRASFFSGQYTHRHGVWSNGGATGGVLKFNDDSTIATWMKTAGYKTSLVGKYLNEYIDEMAPEVPPGWDDWHATDGHDGYYYGFILSENGGNQYL